MNITNQLFTKKYKEDVMEALLQSIKKSLEEERGWGKCIRCQHQFHGIDIDLQFQISYKGETKLSLLCKDCRKEVVDEMMIKWG